MKKIIISSAFSTNMLSAEETSVSVKFTEVDKASALAMMASAEVIYSIVGHAGTAGLLSTLAGIVIPANRENFNWDSSVPMLVATPAVRLAEGQVLTEEEIREVKIRFTLCESI